jgi:hypothetical protein
LWNPRDDDGFFLKKRKKKTRSQKNWFILDTPYIDTDKMRMFCSVKIYDEQNTPSVLKYKAFNGSKFVPKYKAS